MDITNSVISFMQSSYLPLGDTTVLDFFYKGDSIQFSKQNWGLYELVKVQVKYGPDSLKKAFILGQDYHDTTVLYVPDEDRNLSVSGTTKIVGNAYLPQAGIKPAFVDGNYYKGIEKIVEGTIKYSEREIPPINKNLLNTIIDLDIYQKSNTKDIIPRYLSNSFFNQTYSINFQQPILLSDVHLDGNIIIRSDSSITINSNTILNNIICIAPKVYIESNFNGSIQVFAQDSIVVGNDCVFLYPSSLVLLPKETHSRSRLSLGKNIFLSGTVLLYENKRSNIPHIIEFDENANITGDLIAFGLLKYNKKFMVHGTTYCYRFINQTNTTMYENYLIDITLNRKALNPFFVRSSIWNLAPSEYKNKIVKWLD